MRPIGIRGDGTEKGVASNLPFPGFRRGFLMGVVGGVVGLLLAMWCWCSEVGDGPPVAAELKSGPHGWMPPGGSRMGAEFGLGAGEGLSTTLSVFEALVKALHEGCSGGVIDFPETEEAVSGCSGPLSISRHVNTRC
jgi:hypothetical protein